MTKFTAFLNKIGIRRLWESLAVVFASLLVLFCAVYEIALDNSATLNNTFHIESSEIERSDEEEYQYFKRDYEDENALESYYASVAEQAEALENTPLAVHRPRRRQSVAPARRMEVLSLLQ